MSSGIVGTSGKTTQETGADLPLLVIERRSGRFLDLKELWRYRELLYFLIWRDLKVRYKQTLLGAAWALLQPFSIMVAFSLFFHRLAEIHAGSMEYPLYVYSGLLPWIFFANAINSAGSSVVGSQDLVTKVYFPRMIIPVSSVLATLVDFVIAFGMLLVLMLFYDQPFSWSLLLVPLVTFQLILTAVGVGTLLSALTVSYRDFRYVVPFMVQLWMFATPTIYIREMADLNPRWGLVLPLNPVDGLITTFRTAALGLDFDQQSYYSWLVSSLVSLLLLLMGCHYFRRVERSFADII